MKGVQKKHAFFKKKMNKNTKSAYKNNVIT